MHERLPEETNPAPFAIEDTQRLARLGLESTVYFASNKSSGGGGKDYDPKWNESIVKAQQAAAKRDTTSSSSNLPKGSRTRGI